MSTERHEKCWDPQVLIYMIADASGGHINPAVSVGPHPSRNQFSASTAQHSTSSHLPAQPTFTSFSCCPSAAFSTDRNMFQLRSRCSEAGCSSTPALRLPPRTLPYSNARCLPSDPLAESHPLLHRATHRLNLWHAVQRVDVPGHAGRGPSSCALYRRFVLILYSCRISAAAKSAALASECSSPSPTSARSKFSSGSSA